jgi:hypothetical protein
VQGRQTNDDHGQTTRKRMAVCSQVGTRAAERSSYSVEEVLAGGGAYWSMGGLRRVYILRRFKVSM